MSFASFEHRPDIFRLVLPEVFDGISVNPFVSPWGVTDEMLCSFEGTFIGRLFLDSRFPETSVIHLLPTLDPKRNYPCPSATAFVQALVKLLHSAPQVQLLCERDADQETVTPLAVVDDVEDAVERIIAFCKGESLACPTFRYIRSSPL
jgi:hypothetical protein